MNLNLLFLIKELGAKISKFSFLDKLFRPFWIKYVNYLKKKKNIAFRVNALLVLKEFDRCMVENKVPYMLTFGSLLGAVREKGFIKHDRDIDVMIFIENRRNDLQLFLGRAGFKLIRRFSIENEKYGCEESYIYKKTGVQIDIFFIYPTIDNYPYVCCWNNFEDCVTWRESMKRHGGVIPRRIEFPVDKSIVYVPFESILMPIPQNAHQILEFIYGEDYMIPRVGKRVSPYMEHRYIWREKLATYTSYL